LYLRRLGHGTLPALLAAVVFAVSGPVQQALHAHFLVEPLTLLLELALLSSLEAGAGVGVLTLLVCLGVLSKEFFLLLVPILYLGRRSRDGERRALLVAAVAGACGLGVMLWLRWWWTPQIHAPWPRPGPALLALSLERLRESWQEWWPSVLLSGLTPLAAVGFWRSAARPVRGVTAYLFFISFGAPFLNPVTFFPMDIPRLMLYALPAVLPLALTALGTARPREQVVVPATIQPPRRAFDALAWLATAALFGVLAGSLDRYRRLDLQGPRDGPLVLALCRESLRTAARLERGQTVSFDVASARFVWGLSDPAELRDMRWYLREGWGERPHYGSGPAELQAHEATLLIPTFGGADLDVTLRWEGDAAPSLRAALGDRGLATWSTGDTLRVHVPAAALVRGDNLLSLVPSAGGPAPRLAALTVRPIDRAVPAP
jgi:hypothetical protein